MTPPQRWTLVATIIGSGAVFLDGTIVNVALPRIGQELPVSVVGVLEGQTYIVSGYLAVLAALLILAGAMSDHFGRRRVFTIGLVSFAVTSALCGLAPTMEALIVARLLQGAAGALLVPGSLSLITHAFKADERARAFGIWASATSGLVLLGPLLGGLLVDTAGWRFAFLINVPVLAIALWATRVHLVESREDVSSARFDWLGSFVGAVAVGGLSFGLIRGQEREWADPIAWASLVIGTLALIAFPILMATRRDPLVPLDLFRSRTFSAINLATFFLYGALYVTFSYQGIVFQSVLGYTALAAGAVSLPIGISLTVLSTRIGSLVGRYGSRRFLTAGPLLMAAGVLWFTRLPADSAPWLASIADPASLIPPPSTLVDVLPSIVLFGLGLSMVVAPLTSTLMSSVPGRFTGVGSAINNAISRVGQPLLGAIIFIAISATFYATLGGLAPELDTTSGDVRRAFPPINPPAGGANEAQIVAARQASIDAFHQAMFVSAALLAVASAISFVGLRGAGCAARSTAGDDSTDEAARQPVAVAGG